MNLFREMVKKANARKIRGFGFGFLLPSIAFAALYAWWQMSVLIALFIIGIGVGIGNWEGGE